MAFQVLRCGCTLETTVEDGVDTFKIAPCSQTCKFYLFAIEETERQGNRGEIPPPAYPGGGRVPDVWSKGQVVAIVLGRLGRGQTVVV